MPPEGRESSRVVPSGTSPVWVRISICGRWPSGQRPAKRLSQWPPWNSVKTGVLQQVVTTRRVGAESLRRNSVRFAVPSGKRTRSLR
ncbi:hypothetical protein D3C87_1927300 [compost metagenome]